jgi:hypothetical protein
MARGVLRFIISLLILGILVAIGSGIYQAGVAQGVLDAGRVPAGAAVGIAGYGWGFHPLGFLGFLFPLFFLFILFAALRATFWRGSRWSHRHGDGYGWYGKGGPMGPGFGPDGWREERERRMADLHRRLHEEEAGAGGASASGPGSASGSTPS